MWRNQFMLGLTLALALTMTAPAQLFKKKERAEPLLGVETDAADRLPPLSAAQQEQFADCVLKGFAAEGADDYKQAFACYSKALALNKGAVTVWIRRAYVAAKLGQYEVAARDLKEANSRPPVSVTDYLTLAWFLATGPFAEMRDGPRAVACASKALREEPSADAYDMLAAGYAEMKNFGKAQENIRAAIKLYPESGRIELLRRHLELYKERKPWREVWGADDKRMNAVLKADR
ncbi:MAG: hypothetical protein LBK60_10045 [Verrucomicrobiales bacterium]|jgi:tetratricopeptide (TPR) repeat protein|nr:hypothetical protein [Verrucomicrobiales bacterium]